MAATETITSIILIKLIRVSLGTVRHPRRFKIVGIDIQITLKQMIRDSIGISVNRAKKSGMVNITSSVNSRERSGINTIFFFQAEDGIRDHCVTGVQTCALPIYFRRHSGARSSADPARIGCLSPGSSRQTCPEPAGLRRNVRSAIDRSCRESRPRRLADEDRKSVV